eukprot:TRINITY_DN52111_c0_g1_i1.p1 TRINITY_DN52111_c0_g1~~TRINITY_DN52111_c0_g1_i1.p1  ORF type:complete len:118 (+),score=4.35 TRINITY_DN52111_c0_g1_i1:128-481(+)
MPERRGRKRVPYFWHTSSEPMMSKLAFSFTEPYLSLYIDVVSKSDNLIKPAGIVLIFGSTQRDGHPVACDSPYALPRENRALFSTGLHLGHSRRLPLDAISNSEVQQTVLDLVQYPI